MTFHPACEKEVSTYIMKGSEEGIYVLLSLTLTEGGGVDTWVVIPGGRKSSQGPAQDSLTLLESRTFLVDFRIIRMDI